MELIDLICIITTVVRLTRQHHREGTVEVYYNGEWGTVCDSGWDNTDASVVCKDLELGSLGIAMHSSYFDNRSSLIWLDGVFCIGNESGLVHCGNNGIGNTNCSQREAAGVICGKLL